MARLPKISFLVFLALALLPALPSLGLAEDAATRPADVVDAAQVVPGLVMEARYFGDHNFLGRPVKGYQAPLCLLTRRAALALAKVQAELKPLGLGLKVYDCYRPRQAVADFVAWAKALDDRATQAEFYSTVDKKNLFAKGYIAERSSHSRGSTVDMTIIPLPAPAQEAYQPGKNLRPCYLPAARRFGDNGLDMGTGFDCFHPLSHTANPAVGAQQRANRLLLLSLMARYGFKNYDLEWWHYTLEGEPYPETYFDFPVR
ncbi:MAG: M15 family metallopeptidase [Proteobacteria bacterium]|nr:M15 family metallopeptidase [Pseudomonadota bacterium]MBU4384130.1 M15 family metallopeptidase [Pseudomonadota bacterium]MCG2763769.1 M15 family metallopeptidase [Desulfarculaceae bacterium]